MAEHVAAQIPWRRRGVLLLGLAALVAVALARCPDQAAADANSCLTDIPADLRCWIYPSLDPADQAIVDATAADQQSVAAGPEPPDEESGGPEPTLPLDDGIVGPPDLGVSNGPAPESTSVFQPENQWSGSLNGDFVNVWAGASTIAPTLGEVLVQTESLDQTQVLETKLITAPANDGALTLNGLSTTAPGSLSLTAADGTQYTYDPGTDTIQPA